MCITDSELDKEVDLAIKNFPYFGIRRMKGVTLKKHNCFMEGLRSWMWRVDLNGMLLRSLNLNLKYRRQYNIPGPLHLWHIDGNHTLINFG